MDSNRSGIITGTGTRFSIANAIALYVSGYSLLDTAKAVGGSQTRVYCALKPFGIVRSPGISRKGKKFPYRPVVSRRTGSFKVCEMCDQQIWVQKCELNRKRFCSARCRNRYGVRRLNEMRRPPKEWARPPQPPHPSGADHPAWVGGSVKYRGRLWPQIRMRVINRQKGLCAKCRKYVGKSMPVNHIQPYREFLFPEAANVDKNLIGVCQSCHMKMEHALGQRRHIYRRSRSYSSAKPN